MTLGPNDIPVGQRSGMALTPVSGGRLVDFGVVLDLGLRCVIQWTKALYCSAKAFNARRKMIMLYGSGLAS